MNPSTTHMHAAFVIDICGAANSRDVHDALHNALNSDTTESAVLEDNHYVADGDIYITGEVTTDLSPKEFGKTLYRIVSAAANERPYMSLTLEPKKFELIWGGEE
jgi:hypothetical protein